MKRVISFVICICLCAALMTAPTAVAADTAQTLSYELVVEGGDNPVVEPGSIVTVSFVINNASGADGFELCILQNEIVYDQSFFEYVRGSAKAEKSGGNALYQTRTDGTHIIKASFLSSAGRTFTSGDVFCAFQLRVIATEGEGWISCDWSRVKAYDGDNESCAVKDLDGDAKADARVTSDGPCHTFTDVKLTDWFHEAVDYVSLRGLMNGVEDDKFAPNDTMTRAMLVTVLYRLSGDEEVGGENPFKDVKDGQWYTDAVIWAKNNGIVDGISDTEFAPNANVTREQIATIMCRYAKFVGCSVENHADLVGYDDVSAISDWAADSMRWANSVGLITGRTDTTLVPKETATRAEVATILMRFCENILK